MSPHSTQFIHLHVHSEFSLADSLLKVKPLVKHLAAEDFPALALTDAGNLFGLVKFYEACLGQGIKPLLGAEVRVVASDEDEQTGKRLVSARDESSRVRQSA